MICMLTSTVESGRTKCEIYWPDKNRKVMELGEIKLTCINTENHSEHILISTIEIMHLPSSERRTVYHVHYTGWPDHGVPRSPVEFLNVISCVEALRSKSQQDSSILIHCSAGIGRTGVLVVVTVALDKVCALRG